MKRKLLVSLLVIACLLGMTLSGCGEKVSLDSELSMTPEVEGYLAKIDTDYAYDIAETLSYDEKYQDNELGWRTAGSDAEHAAADYLAEEMKNLGLEDVEKSPAKVDKFNSTAPA